MAIQKKSSTTQLKEYLETKQGKTYFISAITLITVAVMLVFAIVPAVTSITDKLVQNQERKEYLTSLENKEENIKSLLNERDQNVEKIEDLNNALPSEINDEYILANMGAISEGTNTKIIAMDFAQSTTGIFSPPRPELVEVWERPFTMSVQGNIEDLSKFLKKVEDFPTIINIEDFAYSNRNVQSQNLNPSDGEYLMNLQLKYYYFQDGAN